MIRKILLYLTFLWMGSYFAPFIHVSPVTNYIISVVLIVLLLFAGLQKESPRLNLTYIILFGVGIVLSMFMAMIYHDQSLLGTAISQRPVYFLACFFVWLKIGLTEEELFPMFRVLTIVTLVVFAISLFQPQWFLSQAAIEQYVKRAETTTDVLCFMPGHLYVLLYLFYLLQQLADNYNRKDWLIVFAILSMFFIYQNRSTLIYLGVIMVYFVIKNRRTIGKNGRIMISLAAIVVLLFGLPYIRTISQSLIGETQEQLEDEEYVRKVAFQYYVLDYNEGDIPRILFGNGQPSKDSEYLIEMREDREDLFLSDLGFIGDWFLFGMLPIVALLLMAFSVFRYPYPQYLKYLFVSFLLVPTIHTFSGNNMYVFYFSLVMYLVCLNECNLKNVEISQQEMILDDKLLQNA